MEDGGPQPPLHGTAVAAADTNTKDTTMSSTNTTTTTTTAASDCSNAEIAINWTLLDPPRFGWTAAGGVADLLHPQEVRRTNAFGRGRRMCVSFFSIYMCCELLSGCLYLF